MWNLKSNKNHVLWTSHCSKFVLLPLSYFSSHLTYTFISSHFLSTFYDCISSFHANTFSEFLLDDYRYWGIISHLPEKHYPLYECIKGFFSTVTTAEMDNFPSLSFANWIYMNVQYGKLAPDVKSTMFLRVVTMWVFVWVMIPGKHTTFKTE